MKLSSSSLAPGAVASGLLLTLAFPDFDVWPLAWVALAPLLVAVEKRRPADAARAGFTAGLVHAVTSVYWVTYTMHAYGGLPWLTGAAVMLLLAAYLALYPAVWAGGVALAAAWSAGAAGPVPVHARHAQPREGRARGTSDPGAGARYGAPQLPLPALLVAPFLWVGLEWVRSWFLSGFPWLLLGYSQYRQIPLIQVADLGGVYAVSFLVLAGNVAVYAVWRALGPAPGGSPARRPARARAATAAVALAVAGALIGGSLVYGWNALDRLERRAAAGTVLPVGVAQGNIVQGIKWDSAYRSATIEVYRSLTGELAAAGSSLVVWPETAVPAFFQTDPEVRPVILATARRAGVDLLFGAPSVEPRPGSPSGFALFNSAYLVGADGAVRGRYDKHHLVPFGEYVPLPRLLFFVEKLAHGIGDFEAGRGTPVFAAGPARIGVVICYEAIFSDLVRRFAAGGATLLVNITNDAWFGRTAAPWQHLAQAALRAAELKLPLVRAANTGVSAIVAPSGRIEESLGLFTRGTLTASIALPSDPHPPTLYARIGDRFAQGCLLAALLGLASAGLRNRRAPRPGGPRS